jgi:hypothetical protein
MKNTFTKNTRLCLCISGAIIAIALVLQICGVGLNLGIDFTGGSLLNYSVGEEYDIADVEKILTSAGYTGSQITKAAPSDASIMLQAEIAMQDNAAVESGEAHVHEDGSVHYGEHTEDAEAEASILDLDKSNIKADGMTDLEGAPLAEPRTPQMRFYIPLGKQVPPLTILRHAVELSAKP